MKLFFSDCSSSGAHVFRYESFAEYSSHWEFIKTPNKTTTFAETKDSQCLSIVALDCEMFNTDKGFEIARLSAVDWDYNLLVDVFVDVSGSVGSVTCDLATHSN